MITTLSADLVEMHVRNDDMGSSVSCSALAALLLSSEAQEYFSCSVIYRGTAAHVIPTTIAYVSCCKPQMETHACSTLFTCAPAIAVTAQSRRGVEPYTSSEVL